MILPDPLIPGTLRKRYKRFLADVTLDDGQEITAHCPNTGSMMGCMEPGSRVWLSRSDDPKRKYPHTWELVEARQGVLVGIHTGRSNALVEEAIRNSLLPTLASPTELRREVRYGRLRSRIDLLLTLDDTHCYVEVKNVTAAVDNGVAIFPDAVSTRGTRHLQELMAMVEDGHRAALVFCVQREDVTRVRPADEIDPDYGHWLRRAAQAGVEILALGARVSPREIILNHAIPVDLE
ncbi:DNA/RNA nuclease SfsA [Ectothiorhodospira sp. BSL-9]|uniref:DNA/RNA nuclease SfsA n=1 Tax=Ectothiorhodospira sp. BSL-9 TaxID=1442136 RepID=UPI0007B42B28|nr:DNA/RNA nuclease SfsA [Ectothiorhodospira sp. BSL-9]ANB01079.1 transcriptional regulator [Ectothiorhodospira sp. BSL-9]TVQ72163.1 MAG: DNA/RNA nuclease SfsA [Chromatiaceae bacterium]